MKLSKYSGLLTKVLLIGLLWMVSCETDLELVDGKQSIIQVIRATQIILIRRKLQRIWCFKQLEKSTTLLIPIIK